MVRKLIFAGFLFVHISAYCQTELTNVYSSFSRVYGGTEDGGISGSERYVFRATKTVVIDEILFENKAIVLTKKDSLVIIVQTYTPYGNNHVVYLDSTNHDGMASSTYVDLKISTKVSKQGSTYYVNVPYPLEWMGTINYAYKGKSFTATKKEKFDDGNESYAP